MFRMQNGQPASDHPTISVIITSYNEGEELHRTVRSVIENTRHLAEVIIVDDGSTDGSCDAFSDNRVRVIRHARRVGVAASRDEGSRAARGDVLCYLDGHQRLSSNCLDRCAQLAFREGGISCPDIKDYGLFNWRLHGSDFCLCPQRGYFSAKWRQWFTLPGVRQITALRVPPYLVPRSIYDRVAWSPALRGWGASEASIVLKAFFTGVPILHIAGPVARHRFQEELPYEATSEGVWRNQAIIARICFDDATWSGYWLPRLFAPHLSDDVLQELESAEIQAEHERFAANKTRTDREFWSELLGQPPPDVV